MAKSQDKVWPCLEEQGDQLNFFVVAEDLVSLHRLDSLPVLIISKIIHIWTIYLTQSPMRYETEVSLITGRIAFNTVFRLYVIVEL